MANKMLIDASHPEETRVVVVRGNRVEEFDFEAANKKQLRGNIYLAKVIRVEPSLQAAFVDYGGNRHGFLAFSEIHPDYYQIPVADRQALLAEDARQEREADDAEESRRGRGNRRRPRNAARSAAAGEAVSAEAEATEAAAPLEGEPAATPGEEAGESAPHETTADADATASVETQPEGDARPEAETAPEAESSDRSGDDNHDDHDHHDDEAGEAHEEPVIEQVGSEDAMEEVPERPRQIRRQYKIQEVIKRRQVLLVQVVKEERGNKGAALTTYLSLAGRYSVLMPNTGRGGGISRKITNAVDRKRLKSVAQELDVPEGMGVILRTAGASRTKAEIKRDFEYLMRLWETVRELTLQSSAPALTYEEGSLVKRAIRDLYNKDIDEVLVAGEAAYKESKDFMRMLMPSHAKNVKPYRDVQPLFARFGVEAQLDAMFSSQVTLKSGGYIVINQTEALVAIDVNSGRATREHNIEDTALKTNCEAADEVARQLRLRDLAGLIVIDFIDMEENRNNRTVERRLKEALKNDRARIQVGRISPFGLMEMSRQRIRTGVLEGSTVPCPHCAGAGIVRATPSVALHVLRAVEEMLIKSNAHNLIVRTRTEIALYILNQKRSHLRGLEDRFGVDITILADETHTAQHAFAIERGEPVLNPRPIPAAVHVDSVAMPEEEEFEDVAEAEDDEDADELAPAEARAPGEERERSEPRGERGRGERREDRPRDDRRQDERRAEGDEGGRRRRRRRRRRGGRDRQEGQPLNGAAPMPLDAPQPDVSGVVFGGTATIEPGSDIAAELALNEAEGGMVGDAEGRDRGNGRRRGRRGGRRLREGAVEAGAEGEVSAEAGETVAPAGEAPTPEAPAAEAAEAAPVRKPRARRPRKAAAEAPSEAAVAEAAPEAGAEGNASAQAAAEAPAPRPAPVAEVAPAPVREEAPAPAEPAPTPEPEVLATEPIVIGAEPTAPRKAGWWAKAKSALSGGD
ncbi:ribonuclease E/G [Alsobacter sp. SYSU M60028]|uniref:Ribonuclease E n=1 Tax=Alsobacter ponti TaxID=2962936 RepID=A0ABT1LD97_9HYPH|nr:ribonuclease E/G [Alsobacter ponti]MCP8939482.1 ribonuclease E/G [Alsobacter ponti]